MERYNIGICAIIKDEHSFIEEWIDYHLSLGFEHIWLFEDYGSKSHIDKIKKYGDKITLQSVKETGAVHKNPLRQCAVYEYFCKTYKDNVKWCAFIDIDEFIVEDTPGTLMDICNRIYNTEFNGFILYWKMYNANGHINRPEGKVIDNYTQSVDITISTNPNLSWGFKSIINMDKNINRWPICHTPGNVCDINGNRFDIRYKLNTPTLKKCYLAHYFTKSWEDWKERLKRGNVAAINRNEDMFFRFNPDMIQYKDELISLLNFD